MNHIILFIWGTIYQGTDQNYFKSVLWINCEIEYFIVSLPIELNKKYKKLNISTCFSVVKNVTANQNGAYKTKYISFIIV